MGCGITAHDHIKVHEKTLKLGLDKPMDIVFIADSHISMCDERDKDVIDKAGSRYDAFVSPDGLKADEMFAEQMAYVKEISPDLLILGGDITDSAMYASIEYVKSELDKTGTEYIYGMGNHDFEYGSEYFSDRAYSEYLPRFADIREASDGYQVREYDGCVILVVDDANNQVTQGALDKLKELNDSDKPIILCTHVPIEPDEGYSAELMDKSIEAWGAYDDGRSRVLLGDHACIPNDITREFIDIVKSPDSNVKIVMSGHIHFYNESNLTENLTQTVTGAGFEGDIIHLHLE